MSVFYGYEPESKDNFLDKRKGGDINNDINMNGNQIVGISHTPSRDDSAVNKKYVVDNFLGTDDFRKQLSVTLFEEYRAKNNHTMYNVERSDGTRQLTYNTSTLKITSLIDQGLNEDNATQTNEVKKPKICTKAEKVNSRYYVKFDGSGHLVSTMNLKISPPSKDIINVFVVYLLKSYSSGLSSNRNCLFSSEPSSLMSVQFTQTKTVIVGGAFIARSQIKIGPDSDANYPYKSKANAGELDKWIVLSVHWDNDTKPAGNNSSVYCNGKKLASFQSAKLGPTVRNTIIGDRGTAGFSPLNGYMGHFMVYKSVKMSEKDILLHHKVFIDRWSIDADDFEF